MKVKICCISSIEEAQMAIACGADALGLVGPMPSGPGILSIEKISEIVDQLPKVDTFLLTSEVDVEKIVAQHKIAKTSTIQLVDELQKGSLLDLKKALPEINIVQVVHVLDNSSVSYGLAKAEEADYILLDSGNPNLQTKELGGTGRTHNWSISRKIVEQCPVPVFLAGGLKPENVQLAIEEVQPYGLDLCSGVRTNGHLDSQKLKDFFQNVKN